LSVTLRDGSTAFSRPPELLGASVSSNRANARSATYRFSVSVPDNAGEPLQAIELEQQRNLETIKFNLDLTRVEDSDRAILPSSIQPIPQPSGPDKLRVTFDPPVAPGTDLEVILKARKNPRRDGIYQFRVEAFPPGESVQSHSLGYGRLHIIDTGDRDRQRLF
ncbi:MAG: DUF2808 domain-containing protein, partial [Cyanobacteria bacterium J06639_1]